MCIDINDLVNPLNGWGKKALSLCMMLCSSNTHIHTYIFAFTAF